MVVGRAGFVEGGCQAGLVEGQGEGAEFGGDDGQECESFGGWEEDGVDAVDDAV